MKFGKKSEITSKKIDSEPVLYGKINMNSHNNKIPKEVSECIFSSVFLINYFFRAGSSCYPQAFLGECK